MELRDAVETSSVFPVGDAQYDLAYAEESAMVDASELIAASMEAAGISRSQLARLLRVSRSEMTARLSGERNITVRNLAKTLHVLGAKLVLDVEREHKAPSHGSDALILEAYRNNRGVHRHSDIPGNERYVEVMMSSR